MTNAAFQCLMEWICNILLKTNLTYYDRTQPVIVQTDTGEYSLGTILVQNGWPIAFPSKTLTDGMTHYANIK